MSKRNKILLFVPLFILFILAAGWVVMALWNAILPDVLHASPISYFQALGLLVLCRILFGGMRMGGPGGRKFGGHESRFMGMSQEEREAFIAEWKERRKEEKE